MIRDVKSELEPLSLTLHKSKLEQIANTCVELAAELRDTNTEVEHSPQGANIIKFQLGTGYTLCN
jgi:molybdopterin-biosynthesis enzyme MoeA-like protein